MDWIKIKDKLVDISKYSRFTTFDDESSPTMYFYSIEGDGITIYRFGEIPANANKARADRDAVFTNLSEYLGAKDLYA